MNNKEERITISDLPAYAGLIPDGASLKNMQRGNLTNGKIVPDEAGTHAFFDLNGERRCCWYEDFAKVARIVTG